jgi:hypothetical protein
VTPPSTFQPFGTSMLKTCILVIGSIYLYVTKVWVFAPPSFARVAAFAFVEHIDEKMIKKRTMAVTGTLVLTEISIF